MKNQIGVWLDFKEAHIIEFAHPKPSIKRIKSNIKRHNSKGGSRSKVPYGPMTKVSESKILERRKHEEKAYFEQLVTLLKEADELYLFGPAEAKDGLLKVIRGMPNFGASVLKAERTDSMTDNQKRAKVQDFFDWKLN